VCGRGGGAVEGAGSVLSTDTYALRMQIESRYMHVWGGYD